ncbi:N-methyl-L-tryptophan oxidase [Kribbella sp. NPDC059898]|uniref:N-methyl-L-tryptophan oxidase n=1 Tax=Kribbella sp. NPDC059898 TaxID=3346995 RepID=UPI00365E60A3
MTNPQRYDVAVLGLGAVGASALWRAAARGASVIGFEQFEPGHPRGSSHGGSRIFRQTLFEGVEYVPLARRAKRLWQQLQQQSGAQLFQRTGGLTIGPAGSSLIKVALESAQAGGFEHELLDEEILAGTYPQHAHIQGDVAVFERGAGVMNPEASIRAAVAQARQHGAEVAVNARVDSIDHEDQGVRIVCGGNEVLARRAIVATGAWFTDLVPDLALPLTIVRSPLVWFTGPDRAAYGPDRFPVFVRKSGDLDGWGITDIDGKGVKIGAGPSAPKPLLDRADDNSYPIDERDTGPCERFCERAFPGLDPVAKAAEPCMNSRTADRDFIIGIPEKAPSLVLAGGFSGHGFKHASASGDVAVDLAIDGATELPIDRFSPERF